jgi:hypothetical protein
MILIAVALVAAAAAVILYVARRQRRVEGFDGSKSANVRIDDARNTIQTALHSVLGNIQRVSKHLNDRSVWSERFQLAKMNPNQLARHYLRSMNREDASRT